MQEEKYTIQVKEFNHQIMNGNFERWMQQLNNEWENKTISHTLNEYKYKKKNLGTFNDTYL